MTFTAEKYDLDLKTGEFNGIGWSDQELRIGWVIGDHPYLPGSAIVDGCNPIVEHCGAGFYSGGYKITFHGISIRKAI